MTYRQVTRRSFRPQLLSFINSLPHQSRKAITAAKAEGKQYQVPGTTQHRKINFAAVLCGHFDPTVLSQVGPATLARAEEFRSRYG